MYCIAKSVHCKCFVTYLTRFLQNCIALPFLSFPPIISSENDKREHTLPFLLFSVPLMVGRDYRFSSVPLMAGRDYRFSSVPLMVGRDYRFYTGIIPCFTVFYNNISRLINFSSNLYPIISYQLSYYISYKSISKSLCISFFKYFSNCSSSKLKSQHLLLILFGNLFFILRSLNFSACFFILELFNKLHLI